MNASCILKCSKAIHALDIPHPAHDIPVMYFIGHVTPKLSSITYSTTTAVTDVITSISLSFYFVPLFFRFYLFKAVYFHVSGGVD